MNDGAKGNPVAEIAAAFAWWRDAGVDLDFADMPASWLKAPAAPAPARGAGESAEPASAPPARDRASWPQDLALFADWWRTEPTLDDGLSGRVPPRGPAGAPFMIVVPEPEQEDRESLLSGPQGRLLDAMLAAMGIAADAAYVASVLPRHTPMADWAEAADRGLGAVLGHHVKLVRPERLIVLGANILPLLGNDPAHNPAALRTFNQEGLSIPLLAGKSLAALIERPRWKAGLWQGWLDWTEGQASRG